MDACIRTCTKFGRSHNAIRIMGDILELGISVFGDLI